MKEGIEGWLFGRRAVIGLLVFMSIALQGCSSTSRAVKFVEKGEFGRARACLSRDLPSSKGNRSYLLRRMELCLINLADGLPHIAEDTIQQTYEVLRTQGINADKTVASVVINERVKFWKGEPFEQAMMLHMIAVQKGMLGEWDNARAASEASLFLLRDFGENARGGRKSTEEIARNAATVDTGSEGSDYLSTAYTPVRSNFLPGYLINAIANTALDRSDEARSRYNEVLDIDANQQDLVHRLRNEPYNTILVVDYGRGPEKVGYGPDKALAHFVPRRPWLAGNRHLQVACGGWDNKRNFEPICDLNVMAADHMWNNLEDVRLAKSYIGSAMVTGGAIAAMSNDRTTQIIGLAVMAGGALMKLGAAADTRHCQILPQQIFLVPLQINTEGTRIELQMQGDESSRLVLPHVNPPSARQTIQMCYLRLPPSQPAPEWMTAGHIMYANDAYDGRVPGDELPYILGGRCVCKPSQQSLERYQQAGFLAGLTLVDLENLYRDEGIILDPNQEGADQESHILEDGRLLECPMPGSVGFIRLFCKEHRPYKPRSEAVRELARQIKMQRESLAMSE